MNTVTLTFGVYASPGKKKAWIFTAYTLWYNLAWEGCVGEYTGRGTTRAAAKKDAIRQASEALQSGLAEPNPKWDS